MKDYADKINFCPAEHMKADALTKVGVSKVIRDAIFYHNPDMSDARKLKRQREQEAKELEEEMDGKVNYVKSAYFSLLDYTDVLYYDAGTIYL